MQAFGCGGGKRLERRLGKQQGECCHPRTRSPQQPWSPTSPSLLSWWDSLPGTLSCCKTDACIPPMPLKLPLGCWIPQLLHSPQLPTAVSAARDHHQKQEKRCNFFLPPTLQCSQGTEHSETYRKPSDKGVWMNHLQLKPGRTQVAPDRKCGPYKQKSQPGQRMSRTKDIMNKGWHEQRMAWENDQYSSTTHIQNRLWNLTTSSMRGGLLLSCYLVYLYCLVHGIYSINICSLKARYNI